MVPKTSHVGIKYRYKQLVKLLHPDKLGTWRFLEAEMSSVGLAYKQALCWKRQKWIQRVVMVGIFSLFPLVYGLTQIGTQYVKGM